VETISSGISDLKQEPLAPSEAYQMKRTTLLRDVENAEHDFAEVEEMYAEYLTAVESTNLAHEERVDTEIAQYKTELQELQRRFEAVQADTERLKEQSLEAQKEALKAELRRIQEKVVPILNMLLKQTDLADALQAAPPTREQIENLQQLNQLRSANENKLHMLDGLLIEVNTAKKQQEGVESKLQGLLGDAQAWQNEEGEAQSALQELAVQADAEKLKLATALGTLDTLRADTDAAIARVSAENARHGDMRKSVHAFEQSNATISGALERVSSTVDALEAQRIDAQPSPELAAAQAELLTMQAKLDSLSKARDATSKKLDEASAALKQVTDETAASKIEAEAAQAATAAAQQELKRQRSAAAAKISPSADSYPSNVRLELSTHISDLEKTLQELDADAKNAADMSHGLEALMLQHSANIAQLEEQRKAHALEARKKVTLAEHRRQFTQQERERLRKLGQELETADAVFRTNLQKINKELSLAEQALVEEYEYASTFMAAAAVTRPASVPEAQAEVPLSTDFQGTYYQRSWNTGSASPSVFDFDINTADIDASSPDSGAKRTLPAEPLNAARTRPKSKKRARKNRAEPAAEKGKTTSEMPEAKKEIAPPPVVKMPHRKPLQASSLSQRSQEDWGWDEDDSVNILRGDAKTATGGAPKTGIENTLNAEETHSKKAHIKPHAPRKKAQHSYSEPW